MSQNNILVVYPEVHKTKVAVFRNLEPIFLKSISHLKDNLSKFKDTLDQKEFRKEAIRQELEKNHFPLDTIEVVMGRSGMVKPVPQGVYEINEIMVRDLTQNIMKQHVTNLGGLIAYELAKEIGKKAYIANPVVVDELSDIARFTGHPLFQRTSVFHALNHKHVANKYAKSINKQYEEINLIVCHIGRGGVSVGAHEKGKVVDVNQAYDGDGPFGVTRTGTLPMGQLVDLCFSGNYTKEEVMEMITEKGGYRAYLGTENINEINQMLADGIDKQAPGLQVMSIKITSGLMTVSGMR